MVTAASAPAAAAAAAPARLSRRRRAAIWTLIALGSLIAVIAILTTWVNRQMLDNNGWRRTSAQLINDRQIRAALSTFLVNQLYANVDVQGQLRAQLPPNLKRLAGPVSGALRQPATDSVGVLLSRPRVQSLFVNSSGIAQQKLINVIENKTGYGISTGNGVVTLDLSPLVKTLGAQLGLPAAALAKVPADAGQIRVMQSSQLSSIQTIVRLIKTLSVWLLVAVLVFYGLAIALARGARRATLRNVGWAFVFVGLLVLVVRRLGGNYVVDSLTVQAYRGAVHSVWGISTSTLGEIASASILYGAVAVLGAVLAGPTRVATAIRREIAPVLNNRPGIAWTVVGAAYLLLLLWGPTHALRVAWGILLIGALLALGVVALRRQTLREFPDAAGGGISAAFRSRRSARSPSQEIARLQELRDAGVISDAEFAQGKASALST